MLFPTFLRDANKTAMTMMQASMESAKTTQENMMRQGELMSKMEMPWKMNWTKGPMPVPTFSFTAASADSTREAFHLMADANMKAWEKAAEAYAAVPGWMKLPYKVPGEFWSKWFDQWQDGKFDAFASHKLHRTSDCSSGSRRPSTVRDLVTQPNLQIKAML